MSQHVWKLWGSKCGSTLDTPKIGWSRKMNRICGSLGLYFRPSLPFCGIDLVLKMMVGWYLKMTGFTFNIPHIWSFSGVFGWCPTIFQTLTHHVLWGFTMCHEYWRWHPNIQWNRNGRLISADNKTASLWNWQQLNTLMLAKRYDPATNKGTAGYEKHRLFGNQS